MKRSDCTLSNMKSLGWVPYKNEEETERLLELARKGAKGNLDREPEGNFVYSREIEDDDSCVYYPRYSTQKYYIEKAQVLVDGNWETAMTREKILSTYKTRKQMYMGD